LRGVLDLCAAPQKFTGAANRELRQVWGASTGFTPDAGEQTAGIDRKIDEIRRPLRRD